MPIRAVYANGPQKAVQIIPAKKGLMPEGEKKKLRLRAYCVSYKKAPTNTANGIKTVSMWKRPF